MNDAWDLTRINAETNSYTERPHLKQGRIQELLNGGGREGAGIFKLTRQKIETPGGGQGPRKGRAVGIFADKQKNTGGGG